MGHRDPRCLPETGKQSETHDAEVTIEAISAEIEIGCEVVISYTHSAGRGPPRAGEAVPKSYRLWNAYAVRRTCLVSESGRAVPGSRSHASELADTPDGEWTRPGLRS